MKRLSFLVLIIICLVISFTSIVEAQNSDIDFYKIGVGDVMTIKVIDHSELDTVATVAGDGTITFPNLGNIMVKDMTLMEIEKEITERLQADYIRFAVVNVSLERSERRIIYTYGQLGVRGQAVFMDNLTVLMAVAMAGGITNDGLFGKLIVMRQEDHNSAYKEIAESGINNGFLLDREVENMILKPNDMLLVKRSETFLVQGETMKRGRFVLEKDMTVLRALLEAGGVNDNGRYGKLIVRRKSEGNSGEYQNFTESKLNDGVIENKGVEDALLQPDDIVIVEKSEVFLTQGEIAKRGRFVLEKDMTLLRALLEAGGVNDNGRYGKLIVRRKSEGNSGEYQNFTESELNDGVIENKGVEDALLQPDDILIVERNKTYLLYGEINTVGEFVLQKNMTVFKALTIARGFTKWGSKSRVKVLRLTDDGSRFEIIKINLAEVIDGNASEDIFLKPGDTIIVSSGVF